MNGFKSIGLLFAFLTSLMIGCGDPADLEDQDNPDDQEEEGTEPPEDGSCDHVFGWEDMPPIHNLVRNHPGNSTQQGTQEGTSTDTCR